MWHLAAAARNVSQVRTRSRDVDVADLYSQDLSVKLHCKGCPEREGCGAIRPIPGLLYSAAILSCTYNGSFRAYPPDTLIKRTEHGCDLGCGVDAVRAADSEPAAFESFVFASNRSRLTRRMSSNMSVSNDFTCDVLNVKLWQRSGAER